MNHRCPYTAYYTAQAGSGISKVYHGAPFQRGHGFFGQMFSRFGVPLLKYLGKKALSTGTAVARDVLSGANIKDSLKQRAKETGRGILQDAVNKAQIGGGRRRRKRVRVSTTRRPKHKSPAPKRKRHSSIQRPNRKKAPRALDIFG